MTRDSDLISKDFEAVKKKLVQYEDATDYETKVKISDELMNMKYARKSLDSDRASIERAKLLMYGEPKKSSDNGDSSFDSGFKLTDQQRFLRRFLSPYTGNTGVFLWHGVGMGKTCTSLAMAENFVDVMQGKVLVISSETLHERFREEIAGKGFSEGCLASSTWSKVLHLGMTGTSDYKKYVKGYIVSKYEFSTLRKLMNKYLNKEKDIRETPALRNATDEVVKKMLRQYVVEVYSDRVIIFDEVHSLRGDGESKSASLKFLREIMRSAKNVRLVLLSATPMYDNPEEIFDLMGLLMLNDRSIPETFLEDLENGNRDGELFDEKSQESLQVKEGPRKELLKHFASNYLSFASKSIRDDRVPLKLSPFEAGQNDERKLVADDHPKIDGKSIIREVDYIYKSKLSSTQIEALKRVGEATDKQNRVMT